MDVKITETNINLYKAILNKLKVNSEKDAFVCYNGKGYIKGNKLLTHAEIFITLSNNNVYFHNQYSQHNAKEYINKMKNKKIYLIVHYIYPDEGDYLNIRDCNLLEYFDIDVNAVLFEYVSKYNSNNRFLEKIKEINKLYLEEMFLKENC